MKMMMVIDKIFDTKIYELPLNLDQLREINAELHNDLSQEK